MNISPPTLIPAAPVEDDRSLFSNRRAAIDEIATTRAKAIRCGLYGTYLFRSNPILSETEEVKESWVADMKLQYSGIARACALIDGHDPQDEYPSSICKWIAKCAGSQPDEVATLKEMFALTRHLIDAVPAGGRTFEKLLNEHAQMGRNTFFPAISRLCDAMWDDLDQRRHAEVDRAKESSAAVMITLKRLQHIGSHVRLVSINASVEAARVGDAGRGLSVIAQEFKSLAEEIQHLALEGHQRIDALNSAIE